MKIFYSILYFTAVNFITWKVFFSQNLNSWKLTSFYFYGKNASGVADFLEVVHRSFNEYLRRIPQHVHELHRKIPHLLSCDDKETMREKTEKLQTAKIILKLYSSEKLVDKQ